MTHIDPGDDADATASTPRSTRRSLIGVGFGVSILGTALATAGGRTAAEALTSATAGGDDGMLLRAAMELELAARDLYDEALDAGADPMLARTMREQHEAYGQAIAGAAGFSADSPNSTVFDELQSTFATSDPQALAEAAYSLESTALATHIELAGLLTDESSVRLVASIASVVARHCAVLADAAGLGDDLDALLSLDAEPLSLEDSA